MSGQSSEFGARPGVGQITVETANRHGWDISLDESERLWHAAIEGMTWELLDLTSDTADREPSTETVMAARETASEIVQVVLRG